jgi:transcriptional regulator with XRE-family HTH domain
MSLICTWNTPPYRLFCTSITKNDCRKAGQDNSVLDNFNTLCLCYDEQREGIFVKFGHCLSELLAIRGWSAAQLAQMLRIDASYVRRWIRGERTPSLNSGYIDQIAETLCEGLDKSYKKAAKVAFEQALAEMEDITGSKRSLHESVRQLLHNAQVASLSMDKDSRRIHKPADRQSLIADLLDHRGRGSGQPTAAPGARPNVFGTVPIPKVVNGRKSLLEAIIAMLKNELEDDTSEDRVIYLTFQSERDTFDGYPELHQSWHETVIEAMNRGWTIHHLCRLSKNVQRSFRLVHQLMDWTNYSGNYNLYYFDKYGVQTPPMEIILVQGKAALLGFAAGNPKDIDAALYLDNPKEVQIIEKYTEQLFLNVEPLVQLLNLDEFFELNPVKDRKSGDHLLCMHDLSFLTVPFEVMENYLFTSIPDEKERVVHLGRIKESILSFQRDIEHCAMRHIYPMQAIERLVKTGSYQKNFYFRPTREDVVQHIEHLIRLLQSYERFDIALISDNQLDLLNRTEWDIKGDHTVMIGIMPRNASSSKVELLAVTEGTMVSAFQVYFDDLWDRINPIHRDKEFVISWLKGLLQQ